VTIIQPVDEQASIAFVLDLFTKVAFVWTGGMLSVR
jgi:hypothetical protein